MGWLAAAISGILAALSYPTRFGSWQLPDLGFLAFFCWVPLFQAVRTVRPRKAFLLAFFAGLFHFFLSQYWVYRAIHTFGGLSPVVTLVVMSLLFLILSAYFGVIFLGTVWICRRLKITTFWVLPFFWVGVEYLRHYGPLDGHPWGQLGYSQGGFLPFIQMADLLGVHGVTFLLVLINGAISLLVSRWRGVEQRPLLRYLLPCVLLVLGNLAYGYWRFSAELPKPEAEIRVGIVQGNIPQEEKWQRGKARKIIDIFAEGTLGLEKQGAQLILWPEASLPLMVSYDLEKLPFRLGNQESDLLVGAITRSGNYRGPRRNLKVHNSALLLNPEGKILEYYHKKKLVPFGEYVPFREILFFAKKMVAEVGDIQPGESFHPIRYGDFYLGVLICYEDIFPYISRIMVSKGANALVNITNDAWYGYSSAPYQHQVFSQFRSVETRRDLIRASNTGVSSLIDRKGKVVWQGDLYTREDFLTTLRMYKDKTWYVKMGDILPKFSLTLSGILMILAALKPKRG